MYLVQDHSAGAYAVDVQCIVCGKMVRLADSIIDKDGPAFRAYYHKECLLRVSSNPPINSCPEYSCRRCH